MGQEEGPLAYIEETSQIEYGSETESSTGSVLLAQEQLPLPTPPPALSSPSPPNTLLPLPSYTMSRHDINLEQVVQQ